MKGRIHPVMVAAALGLACAGGQKVPEARPPAIVDQNLDVIQDLTTFILRLHGTLDSERPATIDRAKWEMVVDGKVISSGEEKLGVNVPAGERAPFEVRAKSTYVSGPDELKAMSDRAGSMLAALRGTLYVNRDGQTHEVPFARSRDVRTPRLPVVTLHDIEGFYSEREIAVQARLGVVNPNNFPLAVSRLTYVSTAAGKEMGEGSLTRADTINPSSTGVFEITYKIDEQTHGKQQLAALIKTQSIPWTVKGELRGSLFEIPFAFDGNLRINISK